VKKFGWSTGPSGVKRNDLVQEIRYDALGRRIFQHTRGKPLCENPCTEAFERYVWDGDQLLYELRSSSGSSQYSSGKQYGRTGYVHGPGIDAPLAIMRKDFQSSAAIRINPFANWRGQYERGNASGGWPLCTGSNGPNCISVAWPAPQARTFLDGVPAEAGDWVGSLIKDQRDASGLLYRRNRYYDPSTGQFTQEDPIGVAGGFNLYGFAGADPINSADPFGLCVDLSRPECQQRAAAGFTTGAAVAVVGGVVCVASGACAAVLVGAAIVTPFATAGATVVVGEVGDQLPTIVQSAMDGFRNSRVGKWARNVGLAINTLLPGATDVSTPDQTGAGQTQTQEPKPQGRAAEKKDEEQRSGN
jgi:RHS repeat-associated protein